jgi:hypothetical protein
MIVPTPSNSKSRGRNNPKVDVIRIVRKVTQQLGEIRCSKEYTNTWVN